MGAGDWSVLHRPEGAAQAGPLPEASSALINPARLVSGNSCTVLDPVAGVDLRNTASTLQTLAVQGQKEKKEPEGLRGCMACWGGGVCVSEQLPLISLPISFW